MTAEQSMAAGAGAAPFGEEPPENVAGAARQRQLGPRIASMYLANPFMMATLALVASIVSLGLMLGISSVFSDSEGILKALMRGLAIFFCFGFVIALTYALATLKNGAQSYHVYAGGFVHRRNSTVRAFSWPEIAELRPLIGTKGPQAGKLLSYAVVPRAGKQIPVPLQTIDGRSDFMHHLMNVMRHNGVPVK